MKNSSSLQKVGISKMVTTILRLHDDFIKTIVRCCIFQTVFASGSLLEAQFNLHFMVD